MDAVWARHESLIKKLYLEERKTLKEVKQILEAHHGFPSHPLSMYETKLRDVLQLRKKLKKGDWLQIHLLAEARGYQSPYDVHLNGTLIPWIKVWKEIRRSGATRAAITSSDGVLPPGVTIQPRDQASQPSFASSGALRCASQAVIFSRVTANRSTRLSTESRHRILSASTVAHRGFLDWTNRRFGVSSRSTQFIELAQEDLPWHTFRKIAHALLNNQSKPSHHHHLMSTSSAVIPNDEFSITRTEVGLPQVSNTIYPTSRDLFRLLSESSGHLIPSNVYYYVAIFTFIFSNGLFSEEDTPKLVNSFGAMICKLPQSFLMGLFRTGQVSIRGIWDRFLNHLMSCVDLALSLRNGHGYSSDSAASLVNLVLNVHPEWTEYNKDKMLVLVAALGQAKLVSSYLKRGASIQPFASFVETSAVKAATMSNAHDCVKLLIETCDVNASEVLYSTKPNIWKIYPCRGISTESYATTHFAAFLAQTLYVIIVYAAHSRHKEDVYNRIFATLEIFFNAEADIYTPMPLALCHLDHLHELYETHPEWLPTVLDISFYRDQKVFERLQARITVQPSRLTRYSVCDAALQGRHALSEHLDQFTIYSPQDKQRFLELVLLELLDLTPSHYHLYPLSILNAMRVRALLQCGVAIREIHSECSHRMWNSMDLWEQSVEYLGINDDMRSLFRHFMTEHHRLSFQMLKSLCQCDTNLPDGSVAGNVLTSEDVFSYGSELVAIAAQLGHFAKIPELLAKGVDINGEFQYIFRYELRSFTAMGAFLVSELSGPETQIRAMCRLLLNSGARLKQRNSDRNCFAILKKSLFSAFDTHYDQLSTTGTCPSSKTLPCLSVCHLFEECRDELREVTRAEWNSLMLSMLRWTCRVSDEWISPGKIWRDTGLECVFSIIFQYFEPEYPSTLALMIASECEDTHVQAALDAGVDVDEPCCDILPLQAAIRNQDSDMVFQLLNLGASVNYAPRGATRGSALYEACSLGFYTSEERQQKTELVVALIDRGADINGRAGVNEFFADHLPSPPIVACAIVGDMECATLLLQREADPNLLGATQYERSNYFAWYPFMPVGKLPPTALDAAACNGRLDMTQLLLKVGSLSSDVGSTGYDGAIMLAKENNYAAVVQLIRAHAFQNEQQFQQHPELREAHCAAMQRVEASVEGERWYVSECYSKWMPLLDEIEPDCVCGELLEATPDKTTTEGMREREGTYVIVGEEPEIREESNQTWDTAWYHPEFNEE